MEDLKLFKETHGHVIVSIPEDNSLTQLCAQVRHAHNNPGKSKSKKLTIENITRLSAIGFIWTSQEYVTRLFDERIEDLEEYKGTHGHLSVKKHEDNNLYQFCADIRHSLKQVEKGILFSEFSDFLCPRHFIRVQGRTVITVSLDQLGIGMTAFGIAFGALTGILISEFSTRCLKRSPLSFLFVR